MQILNEMKIEEVVQAAKIVCINESKEFTENRQRVLEILLQAREPISAYEIRDLCNLTVDSPFRATSVYRALDFLESINFVHKLNSVSKYIALKRFTGECKHQNSIFLICKSCQKIEEIAATASTFKPLKCEIEASGFSSKSSQLEVITLCSNCEKKLKNQ